MVAAVRRGQPLRQVARHFGVALSTLQYWLRHAHGQRLDRVDWSDQPRGPRTPANRVSAQLEDRVLMLRDQLHRSSDLGHRGAAAIRQALAEQPGPPLPSVRTIGRILQRHGVLDGNARQRRPPPPLGWYLPAVAAGRAELDSIDAVEGLVLRGGPSVQVLTGVSLHGGLVAAWPVAEPVTAAFVLTALEGHWRQFGLPGYAQFDNDSLFQGSHTHADVIGRVMRLCLSLKVTPVFAPPRETGFQAAIENFNGAWQDKVWSRFEHSGLEDLGQRSQRYVAALRRLRAERIAAAPPRRPFPRRWHLDLQARPHGRLIYLRRTNAAGQVCVLGHTWLVAATWVQRLVRVEVNLPAGPVRCYRLRRRQPAEQPLLGELPYRLPQRLFHE
jgi:hypothetical protein